MRSILKGTHGGFSLIEVLVSMLILLIGLLAMASLQGRSLDVQMEAYQRSQALALAQDMAMRLQANHTNTVEGTDPTAYTTHDASGDGDISTAAGTALGTGSAGCGALATQADRDLCEWDALLKGAAETDSGGSNVGAMLGARGCIYQTTGAAPFEFVIAVAWQGLSATTAPEANCGAGQYGADSLRRVLTLPITIGCLTC